MSQTASEAAAVVEISRETTNLVGEIPNVLTSIRQHLDVARESSRPLQERKRALAAAGGRSCNLLTDLLGIDNLWLVLHANYRDVQSGRQLAQRLKELDVPATVALLKLLKLPEEEAIRLVENARELLEALNAKQAVGNVSASRLLVATKRAMYTLQEEICSRTEHLESRLRTAEQIREGLHVIERTTGALGIIGGLALQFPEVRQAVSVATPQVTSSLSQVAGAVWQTFAVLGPVAAFEEINRAFTGLRGLKLSSATTKQEPLGRDTIPPLEDRLRVLQEAIEAAPPPVLTEFKGPRDLVGCNVVLEDVRKWNNPPQFEIVALGGKYSRQQPISSNIIQPSDETRLIHDYGKAARDYQGKEHIIEDTLGRLQQPPAAHYRIEGTKVILPIPPEGSLEGYALVPKDGKSRTVFGFRSK